MKKQPRNVSVILTSIGIGGALAALLTSIIDNSKFLNLTKLEIFVISVILLLGLGTILYILFKKPIDFFVKHKIFLRFFKSSLPVIIQSQKGNLEFIEDNTSVAVYSEENIYKKIKSKRAYSGKIKVDGKIRDFIEAYNCSCNLTHRRDIVEITYGKFDFNNYSLLQNKEYNFGYCLTLEDTFEGAMEYWQIECLYYTQMYQLHIIFPKHLNPRNFDLFEIKFNSQGEAKPIRLNTTPLLIEKREVFVAKIRLMNLSAGQIFRICWEWNV
ncbi:MAG: hypothetical protein WBG71_10415 [Leeuwenhoekiella sp.]